MRRLTVAQPEAVEVLFEKFRVSAKDNPEWQRLVKATGRAHTRYLQVRTPDARGFYHGLLTGYAVALKALQGKVTGSPPRRVT
jgi:hypothetical protein